MESVLVEAMLQLLVWVAQFFLISKLTSLMKEFAALKSLTVHDDISNLSMRVLEQQLFRVHKEQSNTFRERTARESLHSRVGQLLDDLSSILEE